MKAASIIALGFAASAQAFNLLKDVDVSSMDDWEFMERSSYAMWNGFVRGFYKARTHQVVNEECFGDWLNEEVTDIGLFFDDLAAADFSALTYQRASRVAQEVVDVSFKHNQDCEFTRFYEDLDNFCNVQGKCTGDRITQNLTKNSPAILAKATELVNMFMEDTLLNDEELIAYSDRMMELQGSILNLVLGFKGTFHKKVKMFH